MTSGDPGQLTELYFLDEATALAAGHRPCGECRHDAHRRFRAAWSADVPGGHHGRRASTAACTPPASSRPGEHRTYEARLDALPDGTFLEHDGGPGSSAATGSSRGPSTATAGRGPAAALPAVVRVRTPEPTVAALRAGYAPGLHPSATGRG